MDAGTSLVQAYLHVNGYFTATDYPLVELVPDAGPRAVTDIDMMAVRFGHRRENHLGNTDTGPVIVKTDPMLNSPNDRTDMIVAEVKQGRAQINPGSKNRHALAATLVRFGCCQIDEAPGLVRKLLHRGYVQSPNGHSIRMVLFASHGDRAPKGWHWVHLDHVFQFLDNYLREEHDVMGLLDLHDPALNWLSLLHKCNLSLQQKESVA